MPYVGLLLAGFIFTVLGYATYILLGEYLENKATPVLPYINPTTKSSDLDSLAKGDSFEKYVLDCFNETYFPVHEWRSDKYHNGRYPLSNHFPDLLLELRVYNVRQLFAVECKWRSEFRNNAIQWARKDQIEHYVKYQRSKKLPVFIVIGVGGSPDKPNNLFAIPLHKIQSDQLYLTEDFLRHYTKKPSSNFYLDTTEMMLK